MKSTVVLPPRPNRSHRIATSMQPRSTTERRGGGAGRANANRSDDEAKGKEDRRVDWSKVAGNKPPLAHSLKTILFASFLVLVIIGISHYIHYSVPLPLGNDAPAEVFSEARAREHIRYLSDVIGKRAVGTKHNEVLTVKFLQGYLKQVQKELASLPEETRPQMEVSVQKASGAHVFEFMFVVITNRYDRLRNVVVRLSPPKKQNEEGQQQEEHTLLVNAHFDSALDAPGAADDGQGVAVMMEAIRNLVYSKEPLQHSVVFLFNGGEESLQQASHGFITTHPWARNVRTVINMDGCGSGGREVLFQAELEAMTRQYASQVPRPHGSSVGSDIFKTGLILADSDYRIFRDHGRVRGVDLALYMHGYVYHTMLDTESHIEPGAIQHHGDNALALIRSVVLSRDFLPTLDAQPDRPLVFWDVLGRAMMVYPQTWAEWMHRALVVLVLVFLALQASKQGSAWSTVISIGAATSSFFSMLLSVFAALVCSVAVALINHHVLGNPMSWYAHPTFAVVLFALPALLGVLAVQHYVPLAPVDRMVRKQAEMRAFMGVLLLQSLVLIMMSESALGSAYMVMLPLASSLVALLVNEWLVGASSKLETTHIHPLTYVIALGPLVINYDVFLSTLDVLIPTMGRVGAFTPSDLAMGAFVAIFLTVPFLALVALVHRAGNIRVLMLAVLAGVLLSLAVSSVSFGYTDMRPKRLFVTHVHRRTLPNLSLPHGKKSVFVSENPLVRGDQTDMESFVLISSSDPTSTRAPLEPWLAQNPQVQLMDHHYPPDWDVLYPFNFFLSGYQVRAPPLDPKDFPTPSIQVARDEYNSRIDQRELTLKFDYEGFEWTTLRFNATLLSWSATESLPPTPAGHYMIRHVAAHGSRHWNIDLQFKGKEAVRFDFTAVHLVKSPFVQTLHDALPSWVSALDSLSTVAIEFEA